MIEEKVNLYGREDFLQFVELDVETLDLWEKAGILKAAGKYDEGAPYYDEKNVQVARKLKALVEVGFDLAGLKKIHHKVGLPTGETKGKLPVGKLLTIGELAERSSVGVRTLKHWEEKGLIAPDARSKGGFRLYGEAFVEICLRIRELQLFGYTLEQLKGMSLLFLPTPRLKEALSVEDADREKQVAEFTSQQAALSERVTELRKALKRWEGITREQGKLAAQLAPKKKKKEKPASAEPEPVKA